MREPILHAIAGATLAPGHHLNIGNNIVCEHCDRTVYTPALGTVETWIETGIYLQLDEAPGTLTHSEFTSWCLYCWASTEDVYPVMDVRYAFNSDLWDPPAGQYTQELHRGQWRAAAARRQREGNRT